MRRALLGLLFFTVLAWLGYQWHVRTTARAPAPGARGAVADSLAGGLRTVRLYFAAPDASGLVAETREVPDRTGLHDVVALLVAELDRGPREAGAAALPAGTAVLNVYRDEQGLLTVDLSRAFIQSFQGGSTAEILAVASLVRTLDANLPDVDRIHLVCGGHPVQTLGGHVPLDRPLEVAEWGLAVAD